AAARPDYQTFDLTSSTPLITAKANDQSGKRWDVKDETGLRYAKRILDVEYWRDVRPILQRSCAACHSKDAKDPAGGLVLDDDEKGATDGYRQPRGVPGTYANLALNRRSVKELQARSSMLTWRLFGKRLDGHPDEAPFYATGKTPARPLQL